MVWQLLLGLIFVGSKFCHGWLFNSSQINYRYQLFTTKNPSVAEILTSDDAEGLKASNFDSDKDTIFCVHGWLGDLTLPLYVDLKNALLARGVNAILMEWEEGAKEPNYVQAIHNAKVLGSDMADLIRLMEKRGASRKDVTCVGHSLGAQACGFLGENFPDTNRLGNITGLDPAGPLFGPLVPEEGKLDPSDADFVQGVYSDRGFFGTMEAIGDVNVYPNGGRNMPECSGPLDHQCSHRQAGYYYIDSIGNKTAYQAFPCPLGEKCYQCGSGCNTLGYHARRYPAGTFYLETDN